MRLCTVVLMALVGCTPVRQNEPTARGENDIVDVPQTDVERQSLGSCWLRAHATWIEEMHAASAGDTVTLSRTYWLYWDWVDQIVRGSALKVTMGGNWTTANEIVRKYGLVAENDFVVLDDAAEKAAFDGVNASLTTGVLKDDAVRRDETRVRAELDRIFGVKAPPANVMRPETFAVAYTTAPSSLPVQKKLADAMTEWHRAFYPTTERRAFQVRVQKALHDGQPLVATWFVDFNAMDDRAFDLTKLRGAGPGRQGGHATVVSRYQAKLPDGTILGADRALDPQSPDDAMKIESALDPRTEIQFFRVEFAPGITGTHDLWVDYLDGPVKRCMQTPTGDTDTTNCPFDETPLQDVVLPPGY